METVARGRALIVDDERDQCELMKSTLDRQGMEVVALTSAFEACERIEHEDFDVVLTDMGMSEMSGLELAQRLLQRRPELLVVVVTGQGDERLVAALHVGAFDYLVKPVDGKLLGLSVARAVKHRRLQDEVSRLRRTPVHQLPVPALFRRGAHDIRGSVAIASLILDEIEAVAGSTPPAQQPDLIHRGRRALRKLVRVADRLTRASTLVQEAPVLARARFALPELVRTCVGEATSVEARADVIVELGPLPAAVIEADPLWLAPVVVDAIATAIQRARVKVHISVHAGSDGPVVIVEHDGVRSGSEPEPFADLPLTMADVVLRAHGGGLLQEDTATEGGVTFGSRFVLNMGRAV